MFLVFIIECAFHFPFYYFLFQLHTQIAHEQFLFIHALVYPMQSYELSQSHSYVLYYLIRFSLKYMIMKDQSTLVMLNTNLQLSAVVLFIKVLFCSFRAMQW